MGTVNNKTVEHLFYEGGTKVKLTFYVERTGNLINTPDTRDNLERRR